MSKIVLAEQSSAPDTPGSGKVAIYVDTSGSLCFRRDDGTIAKIASVGTYTLTIPATGTAALLGVAQTFTAAQTFSNVLTAPGMKPASDSTTAIQVKNAGGTAILNVDTTNKRFGIGTTSPTQAIHVVLTGVALPAKSGISQAGAVVRASSDATVRVLDIGLAGSSGAWIQSTRSNDLSVNENLLLNPNGGKVGINTTDPGSNLAVVGLTDYANNAAAIAAGLSAGDFYTETGTNPKRVCVVY